MSDGVPYRDESPFARDINGFLIRADPKTLADYEKFVAVTIDGTDVWTRLDDGAAARVVELHDDAAVRRVAVVERREGGRPVRYARGVRKAVPQTDAAGNFLYRDGRLVVREATILDAAAELAGEVERWLADGRPGNGRTYPPAWVGDNRPSRYRIPVLCHLPHQRPVAVCRVCSVQIARGGRTERKLFPACQHRVEAGMAVTTGGAPSEDGRRIEATVKTLVRLLAAQRLPDGTPPGSELAALAGRYEVEDRATRAKFGCLPDYSSAVIAVDHDSCILCDRCVRGCNEVRGHFVMGRTGKGDATRIGFDLDRAMDESSCVECGDCVVSCPTSALTMRTHVALPPVALPPQTPEPPEPDEVPVEELLHGPLGRLFGGLSRKFLEWNRGAVVRFRDVPAGTLFARQAEYGSVAFLVESGSLELEATEHVHPDDAGRPMARHSRDQARANAAATRTVRTDAGRTVAYALPNDTISALPPALPSGPPEPNFRVAGEFACLSNYPHEATVTALTQATVLAIRRNVLLQLLRDPAARQLLRDAHQQNAETQFRLLYPLFVALGLVPPPAGRAVEPGRSTVTEHQSRDAAGRVARRVEFLRVDPGQLVYGQGEAADYCYIVRVGFVRVTRCEGRREVDVDYVGPRGVFGESEFLASLLEPPVPPRRTSCRALDHVEVIRAPYKVLATLARDRDTRAALVQAARDYRVRLAGPPKPIPAGFFEQGLFNARSLLVLDLDRCTRCDECTRACAETHGDSTRLLREGLRLENYLVTTSCRSCLDPTCMVGCPVDAIHRKGFNREIVIESYCIACGLCARGCPYGNIVVEEVGPGGPRGRPRLRAATCDQCDSAGGDPNCVYACPHDAAHRMNGEALLAATARRAGH